MKLHANLIGGQWVDGNGKPNVNPSNTDDVIGEYSQANKDDALRAIAAAKAAFPAWSRSGIQQRHDILRAASDEVLRRRDELGRLLAREEGKTLAESHKNLDAIVKVFKEEQQRTGIKLLWGTANLASAPIPDAVPETLANPAIVVTTPLGVMRRTT